MKKAEWTLARAGVDRIEARTKDDASIDARMVVEVSPSNRKDGAVLVANAWLELFGEDGECVWMSSMLGQSNDTGRSAGRTLGLQVADALIAAWRSALDEIERKLENR